LANIHVKYSFVIPLRNKREADWCKKVLIGIDVIDGSEPAKDVAKLLKKLGEECVDLIKQVRFEGGFTTHWEVQAYQGDLHVWLYQESDGNVDGAACFAQAYLRKFKPDGAVTFEWAVTCDRPINGNFHGGAYMVTAEKLACETTADSLKRLGKKYAKGLDWLNEQD